MNRKRKRTTGQKVIFFSLVLPAIALILYAGILAGGHLIWALHQVNEIKWNLPATIYAEPPVLSSGTTASRDWVVQYLKRLNYIESRNGSVRPGEYLLKNDRVLLRNRPYESETTVPVSISFAGSRILKIHDLSSQAEIPHFTLEAIPVATLFGEEAEKRTLIKLKDLPKHVVDAVISIEDRRFFKHSGIDLIAIGRALYSNIQGDGPFQGGSTITQQLVKNLYLTPEKTMRRKLGEAVMATVMEARYRKEQILEFYLNEVYLGQQGSVSIKGIGEAAQFYFKKDVRLLSVPEAATLAGLIQAPNRYDPFQNPDKAKLRRNSVLIAMKDTGALSDEQFENYSDAQLVVSKPEKRYNRAPYFLTYLNRQLKEQFSNKALHQDDYRIVSTLDYDMQIAAQNALAEGLARIDRIRGKKVKPVQGSLIAVEPSTGKIRAFVGGRSFTNSQFDRLTQARRQPGSSFKPFVFAAAMETAFEQQQRFYTASSLVEDEPWSVQIGKATWQPKNHNGNFHGVVSLRMALAKSMNVATAKLASDIGFHRIYDFARRAGFQNLKPYPSIALGAFEVSPFQMIQAYTAFANGGKIAELQAISQVRNEKGEIVPELETEQRRLIREETAYLMTDMMKTVMTEGTAASVRNMGFRHPMAGKTGTTNDFKDAWFVGYTPDLICLVWVGYDDNTPVRMTGAQAALPIWSRFMKEVLPKYPVRDFPRPRGILEREIDPYTGKLASYTCPYVEKELFIAGTEPFSNCTDADHYLPIDYFLGPENRVQNTQYYTWDQTDSYNISNIHYDDNTEAYTNHGWEEEEYEDSEQYESDDYSASNPVDYSEESFPQTQDQDELDPEPTETQEFEQVFNDSESPGNENPEEEEEYLESSTEEQSPSPIYMAPSTKKKKGKTVFTNKDIPEAQTTTDIDEEN